MSRLRKQRGRDLRNRLGSRQKHGISRTILLENERPVLEYDSDTFDPSKYDDDNKPDDIKIMSRESGERRIKVKPSSSSITQGSVDRKRLQDRIRSNLNVKRPRLNKKESSDKYRHRDRSRSANSERHSLRSRYFEREPRERPNREREDDYIRKDSQQYGREPFHDSPRRDREHLDHMTSRKSRSPVSVRSSYSRSDRDRCVESPQDNWQYENRESNDRRGYQNHNDPWETRDTPERCFSPNHTGMGSQSYNQNIYDRVDYPSRSLPQRHDVFDLQPFNHDTQPNVDFSPERRLGNEPPIPYQSYRRRTRSPPPRTPSQHSEYYGTQIKENSRQQRRHYLRPPMHDGRIRKRDDLSPKEANIDEFYRENRSPRDMQKGTRMPNKKSPLLMPITINKDIPLLDQLRDKELEQDVTAEIMRCLMKKTVSKHRDKNSKVKSMTVQELFEHTKNEIPFESAEQLKSFLKQSDRCFKLITTSRPDKVVAVTDIDICQKYVKKDGSKTTACDGACGSLHICKFYIFDTCLKPSCDKDHEMFSVHNKQVLRYHGLHRSSPDKIRLLISKPLNRNMTTLPVICRFYNVEGTCNKKEKCPHLHVCKYFVNGTCKFNRDCKRDHGFNSTHNAKILEKFRISNDQGDIALCRILKESLQSKIKSTRYFSSKAASKAMEMIGEDRSHTESNKRQLPCTETDSNKSPKDENLKDAAKNNNTALSNPFTRDIGYTELDSGWNLQTSFNAQDTGCMSFSSQGSSVDSDDDSDGLASQSYMPDIVEKIKGLPGADNVHEKNENPLSETSFSNEWSVDTRTKPKEQNEEENALSDISDESYNFTHSDVAIEGEEEAENDEVRGCCNDTPENGPDDLTDTKSLPTEDESNSEQNEDGRCNNVANNLTNNDSSTDVDGEAQLVPKGPIFTMELTEKQLNGLDDKKCRQGTVDRDETIKSLQEGYESRDKTDYTLQFTSKGKKYSFLRFDGRWRTVSETNTEMDGDDLNGATIQQAYDILQGMAERINSSNLEPGKKD